MNVDGKNVLAAVQQVRGFLAEISKMLLEVDAMMGRGGCRDGIVSVLIRLLPR